MTGNCHARCGVGENPEITSKDYLSLFGQIPRFEELLATMHSMEISVNVILQNLTQLKKMYKDSWENVIGNCDSMLFLGGQEPTTLEHISKMLGKETIDTISHSRSRGKSSSSSTNDGILGRELMTVDELKVMKDEECILFVRGIAPFFSKKFVIEKHLNYSRLEDSNKKYAYGMENITTIRTEKLTDQDEEELMSEPVEENSDGSSPEIADVIKETISNYGGKIVPHEDIDCPTEVETSTIDSNTHDTPLLSGANNQTEFKPEKAVADDGDTLYNANSPLDNGEIGDE